MKPESARSLPTLEDCVHCGLCLPVCPTYAITGREVQSPRGRIAALRAIGDGRATLSPALREGLEDCLVCRACESACPSGISMEHLMEGYRRETRQDSATDFMTRLELWFLGEILPFPERRRLFTQLVRWGAPLLRLSKLPVELPTAERLRQHPRPPRLFSRDAYPPNPEVEFKGRVTLLRGCIADDWFRPEAWAAARVLAHNGWHVTFTETGCCGALWRHAGASGAADDRRLLCTRELLSNAPDHVVVDAAGCAATLLEGDRDSERTVAAKLTDTCTLLVDSGWTPPPKLAGRWVVAPPCHQRHSLLSDRGTREVLEAILTDGYRELGGREYCCGAAGLYQMRRPGLSRKLGAVALDRLRAHPPPTAHEEEGVITANPGCQMRWESLLGSDRVLHPVVALALAYGFSPGFSPGTESLEAAQNDR